MAHCPDGVVEINEATGTGQALDTTEVTFPDDPTSRHRERINVSGCGVDEIAEVKNVCPETDAFGLVTRDLTCDPNFQDPGIPGTIVRGSHWQRTGFATITAVGGNITLTSPTPTATQRIVVTDWDYSVVLTANLSAALNSTPQIREVSGGSPVFWQYAWSFVGVAKSGEFEQYETNGRRLLGNAGEALEYVIPVGALVDVNLAANLRGYIIETA